MDQVSLIDALKTLTEAEEQRQDQLRLVAEMTACGLDASAVTALLDRMDEVVHALQLRLYELMSTDPGARAFPPPPPSALPGHAQRPSG